MNKEKLIDLFYVDGVYQSGKWRNKKYVERELELLPGDSLAEKVWNGLFTRHMCYCGKPTGWLNSTSGYRQYCSPTCAQLSPFLEFEKRHRHEKLWSNPEWKEQTAAKMKLAHFNSRTPKKLQKLLEEKSIIPLDEITPGQSNEYRWQHTTCGQIFTRSFARTAAIFCPQCHVSQGQGELFEFIRKNYKGQINVNDRKAIAPKEIDIYLPELKLGFEFNGSYWHQGDGSRERFKTDEADALGIKIVHVWETEWKKDRQLQEQTVLRELTS